MRPGRRCWPADSAQTHRPEHGRGQVGGGGLGPQVRHLDRGGEGCVGHLGQVAGAARCGRGRCDAVRCRWRRPRSFRLRWRRTRPRNTGWWSWPGGCRFRSCGRNAPGCGPAADPDPEATNRRLHRARRLRRYVDGEGFWNLHAKGTPQAGAAFTVVLDAFTDRVFSTARRAGRTEPVQAYAFDALMALADQPVGPTADQRDAEHGEVDRGAGEPGADLLAPRVAGRLNPRYLALLRVDVQALHRGRVAGERAVRDPRRRPGAGVGGRRAAGAFGSAPGDHPRGGCPERDSPRPRANGGSEDRPGLGQSRLHRGRGAGGPEPRTTTANPGRRPGTPGSTSSTRCAPTTTT